MKDDDHSVGSLPDERVVDGGLWADSITFEIERDSSSLCVTYAGSPAGLKRSRTLLESMVVVGRMGG